MSFSRSNRTYYKTRREVESVRREGDVVYYSEKYQAYYITRPFQRNRFLRRWI